MILLNDCENCTRAFCSKLLEFILCLEFHADIIVMNSNEKDNLASVGQDMDTEKDSYNVTFIRLI